MSAKRTGYSLRLVLFLAVFLYSGIAAAADWRIIRMSGDVRVFHNNVTWIALKSNYRLKAGDAVWTGRNGRVMLASEDGRVLLSPRSMVKIPAQPLPGNYSVLFQSMGSVEADVDKRDKRHFSIHTPYLAAVVKGTRFTVSIKDGESALHVREGNVEATDRQSGQKLNVSAGQYVATRHGVKGGFYGTAPGAKSPGARGNSAAPGGQSGGAGGSGDSNSSGRSESTGNDDSASYQPGGGQGRALGLGRGNGWGNRTSWDNGVGRVHRGHQ